MSVVEFKKDEKEKPSIIEVQKVWKQYDENIILENICMTVEEGEFVTLVGASGCGKSTFLNMLLGTVKPSRGTILFDDKPIPEEPNSERGIVFQQYSVFPHMTVLQNVMASKAFELKSISGYLFGAKKAEAKEAATSILQKVGLEHTLHKYPHELSGGMKQRLAIAQALLGRPRILLLDEPFGALDPGITGDMHDLVLALWQELNLTVFMVTHDIKEGFFLGTRLWVFDKLRHDPHAPNRYGAGITYDLPTGQFDEPSYNEIDDVLRPVTKPAVKE